MKKTVLALAAIATMGMGQAMAANGDIGAMSFQWTGVVPSAPTPGNGGFFIVDQAGTTELVSTQMGTMTFENDKGVINLVGSTGFGFKVVADAVEDGGAFDPAADKTPAAYHVNLKSIKSGKDGSLLGGDSDYFQIDANGEVLTGTKSKAYQAGQLATISTVKDGAVASLATAKAEDTWQVQAEVAVSTTSL